MLVRWAEIAITGPPERYQAAAEMLAQVGCTGIGENEDNPPALCGFVPVSDHFQWAIDRLAAWLAERPSWGLDWRFDLTPRYTDDPILEEEWKKSFHPVAVGSRFVIAPPGAPLTDADGRIVIVLEPGTSFGTGGHATTRLALGALARHVRPRATVADIGTGSGILAIAAAKLGAAEVYATDTDPAALEAATANVRLNGVHPVVSVLGTQAFWAGVRGIDLVVANILAPAIVELAPRVAQVLSRRGAFIASGIRMDQAPAVQAALRSHGFGSLDRSAEGDWRAYTARRTGNDTAPSQ